MKPETTYALRCPKKDERLLLERVNAYLATYHRTTSKARNPSMLARYLPFVVKHFYWNLNKDAGTWFDIYPNEDAEGKHFFPERKDYCWLMRVRIDLRQWPAATQAKAESFIAGLLSAMGFESVVLQKSDTLR